MPCSHTSTYHIAVCISHQYPYYSYYPMQTHLSKWLDHRFCCPRSLPPAQNQLVSWLVDSPIYPIYSKKTNQVMNDLNYPSSRLTQRCSAPEAQKPRCSPHLRPPRKAASSTAKAPGRMVVPLPAPGESCPETNGFQMPKPENYGIEMG